jgi:hypothetical protein
MRCGFQFLRAFEEFGGADKLDDFTLRKAFR